MATDRQLADLLDGTLAAAVHGLLRSRAPQNTHWNDVRSTGAAVWALMQVVDGVRLSETTASSLRRVAADAATWIVGQQRREGAEVSWESEAWDTSVAMLALLAVGQHDDAVGRAASWLETIRCRRSGVWYDEIWESTLATIAVLRWQGAKKGPRQEPDDLLLGVMEWLNDIPSKPSGEYVNPHYSAFLLWLDTEIRAARLRSQTLASPALRTFREKVSGAAAWIVDALVREPGALWTPYTFANAYITMALCSHPEYHRRDAAFLAPIVEWFASHGDNGFEDTEDAALAVVALLAVRRLPGLAIDDGLDRSLSRLHFGEAPRGVRCFLGYASRAEDTALRLKDYLRNDVPYLTLVDWRWDFRAGSTLTEEIEARSRDCHVAIFLVTRDDLVAANELAIQPRDNVIFEVGVFFGTIGRARTILVVEEGAKLPSDWGGLKRLQFANPRDLSSVHVQLRHAVLQALAECGVAASYGPSPR